jgi:hypothetical protein
LLIAYIIAFIHIEIKEEKCQDIIRRTLLHVVERKLENNAAQLGGEAQRSDQLIPTAVRAGQPPVVCWRYKKVMDLSKKV